MWLFLFFGFCFFGGFLFLDLFIYVLCLLLFYMVFWLFWLFSAVFGCFGFFGSFAFLPSFCQSFFWWFKFCLFVLFRFCVFLCFLWLVCCSAFLLCVSYFYFSCISWNVSAFCLVFRFIVFLWSHASPILYIFFVFCKM